MSLHFWHDVFTVALGSGIALVAYALLQVLIASRRV